MTCQKLKYRTLELVVRKLWNHQKKGPISMTIKSNNGMQQLIVICDSPAPGV